MGGVDGTRDPSEGQAVRPAALCVGSTSGATAYSFSDLPSVICKHLFFLKQCKES